MLIALACSKPPEGLCRWTLSLITEKLVALTEIDDVSTEAVRRRFKENDLKPSQKKMWCVGNMNANYIAQMEHILDVYARPEDSAESVVNCDEAMKQLVSDVGEFTAA